LARSALNGHCTGEHAAWGREGPSTARNTGARCAGSAGGQPATGAEADRTCRPAPRGGSIPRVL
jgi:hypothetical protein